MTQLCSFWVKSLCVCVWVGPLPTPFVPCKSGGLIPENWVRSSFLHAWCLPSLYVMVHHTQGHICQCRLSITTIPGNAPITAAQLLTPYLTPILHWRLSVPLAFVTPSPAGEADSPRAATSLHLWANQVIPLSKPFLGWGWAKAMWTEVTLSFF